MPNCDGGEVRIVELSFITRHISMRNAAPMSSATHLIARPINLWALADLKQFNGGDGFARATPRSCFLHLAAHARKREMVCGKGRCVPYITLLLRHSSLYLLTTHTRWI